MNLDPRIIYLVHIALIAPLLWHVGNNRFSADGRLFLTLKILAIVIVLTHGYKLYQVSTSKDTFNELNNYIDENVSTDEDD